MSSGGSSNGSSGVCTQTDGEEPIYINHCSVMLTLTTARMDFGQASSADQSVNVKSRLVTSPSYFRQIGEIILTECDRYDQAIATPRESGEG